MTVAAPSPLRCPPAESLDAFLAGVLDEEQRREIDAHLAACPDCREIVGALGRDSRAPVTSARDDAAPLSDLLAQTRVGQRIGPWRVLRLLGRGGMGQVFEVVREDVSPERRAALKLLRPELAFHPEVTRRFLRERYAANRIAHRAFVKVIHDGTTDGGAPYFVMDLVRGETLGKRVRERGPFAEPEVVAIGAALLDAIAAAHASGVLHRDLKPDNVTLEEDGSVRILDFGIAKVRDGDGEQSTVTGQMLGTPTYMPPEQARGADIDERVDVYAIGATLVYLLTGKPIRPVTGALFEAMTQPVSRVSVLAPQVSPRLAHVLDRALAFEKNDRYPSAPAMRAALLGDVEELAKTLVEPAVVPVPVFAPAVSAVTVPPQRVRPGRRRWTAFALVGIGACGVGGAAFWAGRHASGTGAAPTSSTVVAASSTGVVAAPPSHVERAEEGETSGAPATLAASSPDPAASPPSSLVAPATGAPGASARPSRKSIARPAAAPGKSTTRAPIKPPASSAAFDPLEKRQ